MPTLQEIVDMVVKRISALTREATSSDLTDGEFLAVDKTAGYTRKMTVANFASWVLGRIRGLSTSITAFRTGDVIPVDGPNGTAKMTKDNLLKETAQNALAGNVAPEFVPNSTNAVAGMPYIYSGKLYVAKENYSGPWDASKFTIVSLVDAAAMVYTEVPDGTTLASCRKIGVYMLPSATMSSITDKPSGYTTGSATLLVFPVNPYNNIQILIEVTTNKYYKRNATNSVTPSASEWYKGQILSKSDFFYGKVYADLGYTTLKQCREVGFYGSDTTDVSHITDLPSGYTANQFFSLSVLPINTYYNLQVLQARNNRSWVRISPAPNQSGTESDWKETTTTIVDHGLIYTGLGYTTLKDCKETGFYCENASATSNITDLPSNCPAFQKISLLVLPYNQYFNLQILQCYNKTWKRESPRVSGYTETDWVLQGVAHGQIYSYLGYTTLKQCRDAGFYGAGTDELSHITDLPSDYPSGQFFSLSVLPINSYFNLQVLQSRDNKTWKRLAPAPGSSQAETEWVFMGRQGYVSDTRLVTLGDSITQGYWSNSQGIQPPNPNITWPKFLGDIMGWSVTNAAVGGTGYSRRAGGEPDGVNAMDVCDSIDFDDYDIVSIAYGINDWHYYCNIGDLSTSTKADGTMVGNMMYCIEKILDDNPSIKIVIVGPFNCSVMGGNFESNWGLGHTLTTSGTLQNVIDKIKSVCDYYDLQYVDCISSNIVNRYNVPEIFADGIHPTQDCFVKFAKCFAKQFNFS